MNKRNMAVLVVPLMILLQSSNGYASGKHNTSAQNFVTGVCAVGAAVLAGIGAVAVADWYFSETDDQLIARLDRECCSFESQYSGMVHYLRSSLDNYSFSSCSSRAGHVVDYHRELEYGRAQIENVVYVMANRIETNGIAQSTYRNNVCSLKNQLQSSKNTLCKRIHALERKNRSYVEQQTLCAMNILLNRTEELIIQATFLSGCLEYHKSYFNAYEIVSKLHNSYANYCTIAQQSGAYAENDLKTSILGACLCAYPFRNFVKTIESDISRLRKSINSLAHDYTAGRHYANNLLNQLVWMKNVVTADYRYSQECYQWEQDRLQRLQIEALEAQARAARQHADAIREQNRILEHNNYLKQQALWQNNHYSDLNIIVTL
jgi:hypothetical protein